MKPTQEQIIAWAREAGFEVRDAQIWGDYGTYNFELERFAALAAIAEREACADICDHEMENAISLSMKVAAGNCADKIRARGE